MARTTPLVDHTSLREATAAAPIEVGTAAWYHWLEAASTFAYVDDQGTFTARKERRGRDGWYWKAYRRWGNKLHRAYLGKSAELTLERLIAAATALAPDGEADVGTYSSPHRRRNHATAPHANPILATKLFVPRVRPTLLPRPRLLAQLAAALAGPLTLLSAPAGFGKTTLLAAWRATPSGSAVPLAWVSLDAADDDPVRFWSYVIIALDALQPGIAAMALPALQSVQAPPIEAVLTGVLNALSTLPADAMLVLDDYHILQSVAIHTGLTFLVEHLPVQAHLVIATREDPPLPLARLRARGQLTELRAADLRLTPDEAARFLTGVMGLPLTADEVIALDARTEGWIAGLHLAALAMRDRSDLADFIALFTGSNRFILDYLASEVLDRLPPHLHMFVVHSSILDRMCGPLCDAVMGDQRPAVVHAPTEHETVLAGSQPPATSHQPNGERLLAELERMNLFLVPLDHERHWYRYHHLFADVLRERLLRRLGQETVARLHGRASVWYERHALVTEAIHHALRAADGERAAHLIEQYGLRIIVDGQLQTVLGWLSALPETLVRARPMLCILHAFALVFTSQLEAAEARVQDAERSVQPDTPPDQVDFIRGYAASVRANSVRYRGDLASCVACGQQVLRLLPETEVVPRTVAMLHAARAFRVNGDVTEVNERLAVAVVAPIRASTNVLGLLAAVTNLARLQVLQGRRRAAAATYREAAQIAAGPEEVLLVEGPAYYVGMGELLREWNDLDAAEGHLAQAMAQLTGMLAVDAEDLTLGYLALARLQHARGDYAVAHATLDTFTDLARRRGFVTHLGARGAAVHAQLALAEGNLASAISWADADGLSATDDLSFPREAEYLILARVWIARAASGSVGSLLMDALHLLDRLLAEATAKARMDSVVEILIVRALALWAQGTRRGALATIARALTLAVPEGYIRRFVDEGPSMAELLQAAAARGIAPDYVTRLLAAFEVRLQAGDVQRETPVLAAGRHTSAAPNLTESLSDRELDVLQLVAAGRSNQEIAETLVIAVSTVKKHINNIYGKLEVQSRTQALVRARALNLL